MIHFNLKKNISIALFIALLISVSAGCAPKKPQEVVAEPTPVEVSAVKSGDIDLTYSASGVIKAFKEISLVSEIPGKVESARKEIGDSVQSGELLFTLKKVDLYKQIEQLDAQLRQQLMHAEAALEQAEIQFKNAKEDYNKNLALYRSEVISKQVLEGYEKAYEMARVQYENAEKSYLLLQNKMVSTRGIDGTYDIEYAKSTIEAQRDSLIQKINDSEVKSPITGIIAAKNIEVGEMASLQIPAYTIVNIDKVIVETGVTERVINKVKVGQEVIISVKALGDKEFKGIVEAVSPAVTNQSAEYPIKIIIDNKGHELKPGMFSRVSFITEKKSNVILVPLESVITNNNTYSVFVFEGDEAKRRDIKTGFKNEKYYEAIEGLKEDEKVLVKGQHFVVDGEKVRLVGGAK